MSQQWLSVIGIALDAAGFMILLFEWWLAFFNEERQLGFQRQLERERDQGLGGARGHARASKNGVPDGNALDLRRSRVSARGKLARLLSSDWCSAARVVIRKPGFCF